MNLIFEKYQGTGNDFVMIDNRNIGLTGKEEVLYAGLCDRRFGVGADGVILINKHDQYDFEMIYINADGREGSMCGNGGRCAVAFASKLGLFEGGCSFLAVDGVHTGSIEGDIVALGMIDTVLPVERAGGWYLNTGSPHHLEWVQQVAKHDVVTEGKRLRWHDNYAPGGTNVNFIEELANRSIKVRTYERGVEAETYSCGTGVTAAAMLYAAEKLTHGKHQIKVETSGGNLEVSFYLDAQGFNRVMLLGPAKQVFLGSILVSF
ncbi:MAG: diaminopimelate epimerase [Bacteroidia bacterium]